MWGDIPDWAGETVAKILLAVKDKDPLTSEHCLRVGEYSRTLARFIGLNEYEQNVAEYAGVMHDVGKILIPSSIIHKPGPLNDSEFQTMKMHPTWSATALAPHMNEDFFQKIIPGVLHHHERLDGRGYPDRLIGDDIPLMARIIALVDTLDAITQTRSYRQHQSFDYVLSEVKRCSGTQFDRHLAKIFLETSAYWEEQVQRHRRKPQLVPLTKVA